MEIAKKNENVFPARKRDRKAHRAMAEAAASPKPEGWEFRDRDVILKCLEVDGVAPFTAAHPTLGLQCERIKGPFSSRGEMTAGCNAWSHDAGVQPLGVFKCRGDGGRLAHPKRGRRYFVRCSRGMTQKLACPFKLVYERAEDGFLYLQSANISHAEGCRNQTATPAERLAAGDHHIPPHLIEIGVSLRQSGISTGQVNRHLMDVAQREGMEAPTWRYDHLLRALDKHLPDAGVHDTEGVLKWLFDRDEHHGLYSAWDTNADSQLTRLFYVVDGALDEWARAAGGMRLTLFDTTHNTNVYGMRLGCFTASNSENQAVLLAVSLVNREDAQSFEWVYEQFKKAFGTEPDTILTDGDLAMAAAAKKVLPASRHLLCVWHISQNLLTHVNRLFPNRGDKSHVKKRKEFKRAFEDIMRDGGPGLKDADEYFEEQWAKLMEKVTVDAPPPASVIFEAIAVPADDAAPPADDATRTTYEEAYESAEEELRADPNELDGMLRIRAAKRRKKSSQELVWEWLAVMKATKKKWARVYTREAQTRGKFVTNLAEAMHSKLKLHYGGMKKLLELVKYIDAQRKFMEGRKRVRTEVKLRDQEYRSGGYPPVLEAVRVSLSPGAFELLLEWWESATPWVCREIEEENVDATEAGGEVDGAPVTAVRRFRVGTTTDLSKDRAVEATMSTCSARCPQNWGLPCAHILRVHQAMNAESMSLELVHPFWRRVGGNGGEMESESESDEDYHDAPAAMDFEAGEAAEEPEQAARGEGVRRNERFAAVMQAARRLAELAKGSREKFADVLQEMEQAEARLEAKYAVTRERPGAAGTDPVTGEVVMNPSQVRRARGRTDSRRKRGPGGR